MPKPGDEDDKKKKAAEKEKHKKMKEVFGTLKESHLFEISSEKF